MITRWRCGRLRYAAVSACQWGAAPLAVGAEMPGFGQLDGYDTRPGCRLFGSEGYAVYYVPAAGGLAWPEPPLPKPPAGQYRSSVAGLIHE